MVTFSSYLNRERFIIVCVKMSNLLPCLGTLRLYAPFDDYQVIILSSVYSLSSYRLHIRTPQYCGQFTWYQRSQNSYNLKLDNTDTSKIRTLNSTRVLMSPFFKILFQIIWFPCFRRCKYGWFLGVIHVSSEEEAIILVIK